MKKCSTFLFIIFLAGLSIFPANAAIVDELQQKIDSNQSKLQQSQTQRKEAEAESKSIAGSINQLDQQISSVENDLNNLEKTIANLDKSIKSEEQELDKANSQFESRKELFKTRLKSMYEGADISYIEVLLNSKDLTDMYSKFQAIRSVSQHDTDLLNSIENTKNQIEEHKKLLTSQKAQNEEAKKQRTAAMNSLTASRNTKQDYLKKVNSSIDQFKKSEQELQKQSDDFAKMIKQIIQAQSNSAKYTGGIMKWPVPGSYTITDPYGPRIHPVYKVRIVHTGMDIGAPYGTDIIAAGKGTVIYAQWNDGGYGNCVIVDHGGGVTSLYGHCSRLLVKRGDTVNAGTSIAKVGSTGISTGNHLHFEVRVNGEPTDPGKYLK